MKIMINDYNKKENFKVNSVNHEFKTYEIGFYLFFFF